MKLIFVDIYKKDRIIATVQSDIIPTSSRGGISDFITQNELKNFEVVGNIYNSEWKLYGEYL